MSLTIPKLPSILIQLQLPLLHLTNILGLAITPKHHVLRIGVTFPVIVLLASQSLHREWSGGYGIRYGLECAVLSVVCVWFDWVVLKSPDREGWHKIRYDPANSDGEKEKEGVPQGFWARAWWGLRLVTGPRFVGWSQQVKNVPVEVEPGYSRWLFIVRKSLRVSTFYFLADLATSYTAGTPHGSWIDIAHIKPAVTFAGRPFWIRFWFAWVQIVMAYAEMEKMNAAYGVVSVATGLADPRDCPSMFGDLKELYTVRKAWSVVWHQNIRRICSAPGIVLVRDVLHLPKGSFASKYLQLFVGFGISGVVHGGGAMLTHGSLINDGSFAYFIGQAVVIMIEDHVIDFGKKLGFRDSMFWRLVGFIWTVLFIGASCQKWSGIAIGYGMWVHQRSSDWFGVGPEIVA